MLFKLRNRTRHALRISSGFLNAPQFILPRVHKLILPVASSNRLKLFVGRRISQLCTRMLSAKKHCVSGTDKSYTSVGSTLIFLILIILLFFLTHIPDYFYKILLHWLLLHSVLHYCTSGVY